MTTLVLSLVVLFLFSFVVIVQGDASLFGVFDFIVVGSGAAGSIVATRLVTRTTKTVLLLEGGEEGTGQRDIGGTDYIASYFKTNPVTGKQVLDTPVTRYDVPTMFDTIRLASDVLDNMWNISAVGPFFQQAKVVGGNHATNGLAWTPVVKRDLDEWNIPGYSSAEFWPYLKRVENATETGYGNSPNRGNAGLINIKFPSFTPLDTLKFRNACIAAGYADQGDYNSGVIRRGIYRLQTNVKEGIRQSSSVGYLAKVQNKENLKFLKGSIVTRVLWDPFTGKSAIGVEYLNKNGVLKKAYATKEVILAAGDLQVAKVLYNSGIGPKSVLDAFGKPRVVVNDIIGQRIRNHQRITIAFNDSTLLNVNYYANPAASIQYARTKTGIQEGKGAIFLTFNSANCTGRCPDLHASSGAIAGAAPTDVYAQNFGITIYINHNKYAEGTLNLTSSDPLAGTIFTANILQRDEEVRLLADGILQMRKLILTHWKGKVAEIYPGPSYDTIEKLMPWIRDRATTTCHYYGSTPMGTKSTSVTDPKMLVRGVSKLRIVGPSVIPNTVYPAMQFLTLALGEKGADLILEHHGLL